MPLVTRQVNQGRLFVETGEPTNTWLDGDLWSDTTANILKLNVAGTATDVGVSSFSASATTTYSTTIGDYVQPDSATATSTAGIVATGGTITNVAGKTIHRFTSSGTFEITAGTADVEHLVVAGGGGGGAGLSTFGGRGGGGGGAGGMVTATVSRTVGTFTVTIGPGGAANTNGGASVFGPVSTIAGGRGGQLGGSAAANGGSGGGAPAADTPGDGTVGQGNDGATGVGNDSGGGGGGGKGSVGGAGSDPNGGTAGAGQSNSITGAAVTYATGAKGGDSDTGGAGAAGTVNTGEGGEGGEGTSNSAGGAGGSGVVILSYDDRTADAVDDDTSSFWESLQETNPAIFIDEGESNNFVGCALFWNAATTETEIQIRISTDSTFTSSEAVRTITTSNLTDGAFNFIRFNVAVGQFMQIFGNSGSSLVLAINEIKSLLKTDNDILADLGILTISPTDTSLDLDGT